MEKKYIPVFRQHVRYYQGRRNNFYLGVARIIRKMRFCEFLNFLLYKSPILGVARATLATPVPTPLSMQLFSGRSEHFPFGSNLKVGNQSESITIIRYTY